MDDCGADGTIEGEAVGGVVGMIRGFGVENGTGGGMNCGVNCIMFAGCSVDTRVGGRVGCSWDGMVPVGSFGTTNGKVCTGVDGVVCGVAVGEVVWGGTVGEVVAGGVVEAAGDAVGALVATIHNKTMRWNPTEAGTAGWQPAGSHGWAEKCV